MSFSLDKIFTTATAFGDSASVIREAAPCEALKPYVRCFWEIDGFAADTPLRIIPDCCADILICFSNGKVQSNFCGVSNRSFMALSGTKLFGIRFYSWSVCMFSSVDMNGMLNAYAPADAVFDNFSETAEQIYRAANMYQRISVAQKYLLGKLRPARENNDVMNGIYKIVTKCARVNVEGLADYCAVSKRSLERGFRAYTGLSPKQAIELIRYQLLWQQYLRSDFNALDSVEKFGFYDAAHLYNDFKKYHGCSLPQVIKTF